MLNSLKSTKQLCRLWSQKKEQGSLWVLNNDLIGLESDFY